MGDREEHASNGAPPKASSEAQPSQTAAPPGQLNPNSEVPMLPMVWLYTAIGIPLLILGIRDGWGYLFRSGDAAAFIVGAIAGALVENIIELSSDKFELLKKSFDRLTVFSRRAEDNSLVGIIIAIISYYIVIVLLSYYAIAILLLVWNGYFSFRDLTVHHPTVDWVQITVFFSALCLLPIIRWIFTAQTPFPLNWMQSYVTRRRES